MAIDIEELKRILKLILRFYRERLKWMVKRKNALFKIAYRWKYVNNYPDLYKDLRSCLRWEKITLRIILKKEKEAENQIIYALNFLKSNLNELEKNKDIIAKTELLVKHKIKLKDLIEILNAAIDFLEQANKDIKNIQKRIKHEEKFIKNPTEENFNKFIKEWRKEDDANKKLLQHIKKTLKIIKERDDLALHGMKLWGAGIGGGAAIGAGIGTAVIKTGLLTNQGIIIVGAAIGSAAAFIGFILNLYDYCKNVVKITVEDEELIKKIMKAKGIKMHWWKKL